MLIAIVLTVGTLGLLGAGAASAAPAGGGGGPFTCSGTPRSPGVLAGRFSSVVVVGTCVVNAGPASVRGNVIVTPGSRTLASEKAAPDMSSLTRPASLAGLPALAVPVGRDGFCRTTIGSCIACL